MLVWATVRAGRRPEARTVSRTVGLGVPDCVFPYLSDIFGYKDEVDATKA